MLTLIPYRRYANNMQRLRGGFRNLMDDQFFRSFMNLSEGFGTASFRVDIREKGDAYLLQAELPGLNEDKIKLSVDENMLTISADFESEEKIEQTQYAYCERRSGHVERSFNVEGINQDAITADYDNGILSVTLPKSQPEAQKAPRKIAINTARLEAAKSDETSN